jgi:hypothetical protein
LRRWILLGGTIVFSGRNSFGDAVAVAHAVDAGAPFMGAGLTRRIGLVRRTGWVEGRSLFRRRIKLRGLASGTVIGPSSAHTTRPLGGALLGRQRAMASQEAMWSHIFSVRGNGYPP